MNREIIFSKRAGQALANLLDHMEINWSTKVQRKFISKLDQSLNLIQSNPETFSKSELNEKLYKCVVTKQTTIYYRFNSKRINIVSIFDTRQNPNRINKIK